MRIDKWLWHIRAFKSRTRATDACNGGKVKLNGKSVKPSHIISVSDTVQFQSPSGIKIFKATALIERRVSAEKAKSCYEDLSPPAERSESMPTAFYNFPRREKGAGRPTKKERRTMERWRGQ